MPPDRPCARQRRVLAKERLEPLDVPRDDSLRGLLESGHGAVSEDSGARTVCPRFELVLTGETTSRASSIGSAAVYGRSLSAIIVTTARAPASA